MRILAFKEPNQDKYSCFFVNDNNRLLAKAEITMLKPHSSKIFDINNFDIKYEIKAAFKLNDDELRYIEIYK